MDINFINDNVTVKIPLDNKTITKSSQHFPYRVYKEALFRQINNILIEKNIINKNKNIIDLGSWIGDNSIPWAKKLINGKVYAIDPSKDNCRYINILSDVNNLTNVVTINHAISDKIEKVSTNFHVDHCTFQINDKCKNIFETTTLDNLYRDKIINNIGYIHLDVEGMEFKTLQGSINLINTFYPIITFEQHIGVEKEITEGWKKYSNTYKGGYGGIDYNKISDFLKDKNYSVFMINEILPGCYPDCRNFIAFPNNIINLNLINEIEETINYDNYKFKNQSGYEIYCNALKKYGYDCNKLLIAI